MFPEAHASAPPSGDQLHSDGSRARARSRVSAPAARTKIESPAVKAMLAPSGDHAAQLMSPVRCAGTSWRVGPPKDGALNTPPRERKRTRVPSGDHRGADWV